MECGGLLALSRCYPHSPDFGVINLLLTLGPATTLRACCAKCAAGSADVTCVGAHAAGCPIPLATLARGVAQGAAAVVNAQRGAAVKGTAAAPRATAPPAAAPPTAALPAAAPPAAALPARSGSRKRLRFTPAPSLQESVRPV